MTYQTRLQIAAVIMTGLVQRWESPMFEREKVSRQRIAASALALADELIRQIEGPSAVPDDEMMELTEEPPHSAA